MLALPSFYLFAVAAYLGLVALAACFFRAPKSDPAIIQERPFAVLLIPAHNESHQIESILEDAHGLRYPRDRYRVVVIADNCTDDTADRARAKGAQILARHDAERRGKGFALDWALTEQTAAFEGAEIIALVDADMHIDEAFLEAMAAAFATPETQVVQGLNTVAKPEASWRTALGYVAFTAINHTRPAGRDRIGGTAELKGSGMAFRAATLLGYGWPAHSLAEDAEFSKRLLADGIRVRYQPAAKVTSPIPERTEQANVQQQRWEGGKLHLLKRHLPRLLWLALRRPSIRHLDAVADILVPPMSILVLLLSVLLPATYVVDPRWAAAIGGAGLAIAFYILIGLALQRAPLKIWGYLLAVPLFLAWKLPLYLGLLLSRKKETAWQRTPRDQEID